MTKEVTINVTEKHIKNGKRLDCSCCPIALAAAEELKANPDDITAAPYHLSVFDKKSSEFAAVGTLPDEANAFMRDFDHGRVVTPFSFTLEMNFLEIEPGK